jgi:hypothetical protein
MAIWWELAALVPRLKEQCRCVMSFICAYNSRFRRDICDLCGLYENDTVEHLVMRCTHFDIWRRGLERILLQRCDSPNLHLQDGWLHSLLHGGCNQGEGEMIAVAIYAMVQEVRQVKLQLQPG